MRSPSYLAAIALVTFQLLGCTVVSPSVKRVSSALDDAGPFNGSEITVEGYRESITLSGYVSSESDKLRAEQAARSVEGIRVRNDLAVRPGYQAAVTSAEPATGPLAIEIRKRIKAQNLDDYSVSVLQSGDDIILRGVVSSEDDRARIANIARSFPQVRSVVNELAVQETPHDSALLTDIRRALAREAGINSEKADLSVIGHTVIVKGTFDNHEELDHFLSFLNMIKGVERVENRAVLLSYRNAAGSYRR